MNSESNTVEEGNNEPQDVQLEEGVQDAEAEQSAAGTEEGEQPSLESLLEKLAKAEATVNEQRESVLRAQADVDNMRRRTERDVANAHKFGLEKFALALLPIIDGLERGIMAKQALNMDDISDDSAKQAVNGMSEGMELTINMFSSTLEKFGIQAVDPVGEAFNPQQHEAMSMQDSPDHEPNTVIAVMQKGYLLNERLIRPAMVMVSKPSSKIDAKA